MCGIVSMFSQEKAYNKDVRSFFTQLLAVNTVRGVHSTGMAFGNDREANVLKKTMAGWDFIETGAFNRVMTNHQKYKFMIGHNRAATQGSVNLDNAHPFQHGRITGVHNGTLTNYRSLDNKASFNTDSEYIFHKLNQDEGNAGKVSPKLQGAYNLLWHDTKDNTVHSLRNTLRPYSYAKIKGKDIVVGASELDMLWWIAIRNSLELEEMWEPAPHTEYIFDLDNGDLMNPQEVEREGYTAPKYDYPSRNRYHNSNQQSSVLSMVQGKRLSFWVTSTVPYGNQGMNQMKGKLTGKTQDGKEIVCFDADLKTIKRDDYISGVVRGTASNHALSLAPLSLRQEVFVIEGKKSTDKGNHKDSDPDVDSCMACQEEFHLKHIIYVDNHPICTRCYPTFEASIDKHNAEIVTGEELLK